MVGTRQQNHSSIYNNIHKTMPRRPQVTFVTDTAVDVDPTVLNKDADAKRLSSTGTLPTEPSSTDRTPAAGDPNDDDDDDDEEDDGFDTDQIKHPSQRSQASSMASNASSLASGAKSPNLRGNLTRQHKNRDPFSVYQLVNTLGRGSMGTVDLVRKLSVGGSARYNTVARAAVQEKYDHCFQLPIIGGLLSLIFQHKAAADLQKASLEPFEQQQDGYNSNDEIDGASADHDPDSISTNAPTYAMKSIHYNLIKDKVFVDELRNEIAVLKTLDHPHVVRVLETFDFDRRLFVVMEVCSGGDLYQRDPYTEEEAARIITAVLRAVSYMHRRGVIHRDLKYENIMFANDSPQADIKLIDFGLSKEVKEHENLKEGAGTIYTMAPEVLRANYGKEADLWSIGVIAYMLLSSKMPFFGNKRRIVVDKILKGEYEFKGHRWLSISNQAKMFVDDLLVLDPTQRATAEGALCASWLNRRHAASVRQPRRSELSHVKECIKRYATYPRLRKIALMVIAHRSTSEEIGILRKVFQHYDTNHSGYLTFESFRDALEEAGFTDENYREIFNAVDVDGSGRIRYTEFLASTIEAAGWISEVRLAEAFDRVDHDDTGFITKGNLRHLLGDSYPEDELNSIISEAASDSEEGISYTDFLSQWKDNKEAFLKLWQQNMVPDMVVHESKSADGTERMDLVSEVSFDINDSSGDDGGSNFLEGKAMSMRKRKNLQGLSTSLRT